MRKRYIQHPETLELIPAEEYSQEGRESGPFVLGDIQPYQSMITGEMIMGRRQHREHLRQHGCIEVGNEKLTPKKEVPISRESIRRDLYQVANQMGL